MTNTNLPVRVPTVVEEDIDFTVVASNPKEMEAAQRSLILWCARKIDHVKQHLADTREQYELALRAGWTALAWKRQFQRAEKRVEFYRKIKLALEAGYYIVPPFPINVFAIRTNRKTPDKMTSTDSWSSHRQSPRILPAGEGDYVSSIPQVHQRTIPMEGKPQGAKEYFAKHFLPVDFPFKLAKPAVLSETAKAMALKVFDQMGVMPDMARTADPVVCGQILLAPEYSHGPQRSVTFFVAWWLDTKTL
jgi:hypothetical protein